MKSGFLSLKLSDWLKGLLLAVVVPVLVAVEQSLNAGELTINWKQLGITAVAALIGYVLKNLFTDDTAVAKKVIEKAGGTVVENMKPID
jgi:hypothetical protein